MRKTHQGGRQRRRSYRELQADGELDLERGHQDPPPELPHRTPLELADRQARLAEPWARIRRRLARDLTDFTLHIWIDPLEPYDATATALYVAAPAHIRRWVQDRYLTLLRTAATAEAGKPIDVEIFTPQEKRPEAGCRPDPEAQGRLSPTPETR